MGMFDKPRYLTGDEGFATPGDTFWLHNARIEGEVNIGGERRRQCKLLVSQERDAEQVIVYTSGVAIVNQVARMDQDDRAKLPMEVRLDEVPPRVTGNNPTRVLTPADQVEPGATPDDDIPF